MVSKIVVDPPPTPQWANLYYYNLLFSFSFVLFDVLFIFLFFYSMIGTGNLYINTCVKFHIITSVKVHFLVNLMMMLNDVILDFT